MDKINEPKNKELIAKAALNIKDILDMSIKRKQNEKVLIIYDEQSTLSCILTEGYKKALGFKEEDVLTNHESETNKIQNKIKFLNFDKSNKEEIMLEISKLEENDLVVMIQTTNFRLDDFRIRLHLFSQKLKVIEHMHLNRNDEDVWDVYIDSLAYDKDYYYKYGQGLKKILDRISMLMIRSNVSVGGGEAAAINTELTVKGNLEDAMLNIGDYTGMNNIGGTFPIGEVFTESKVLENMNGEVMIYAFADDNFVVQMYEPFKIKIENGIVVGHSDNAPREFINILNNVRESERAFIREIGFGLNRAITKERPLGDITAFERIYGMHLSLGEKHSMYKKSEMTTKKTKYHVDLFPVVHEVTCKDKETNEEIVLYKDGEYII